MIKVLCKKPKKLRISIPTAWGLNKNHKIILEIKLLISISIYENCSGRLEFFGWVVREGVSEWLGQWARVWVIGARDVTLTSRVNVNTTFKSFQKTFQNLERKKPQAWNFAAPWLKGGWITWLNFMEIGKVVLAVFFDWYENFVKIFFKKIQKNNDGPNFSK